ncbi:MAG: hypothetical protein IJ689_04670 [Alphaproteobacteria bacterium]|nr:hypothetical protein [Alphaproteobacteria bacterium]
MKKAFFILCLAGLLSGCATQAKYAMLLNNTLGLSEEDLINRFGPPDSVYELNSTTKYLTYKRSSVFYNPPSATTQFYGNTAYTQYYGGYQQNVWCNTTFTIKSQTVSDYRFEGNDCVAM